MSKLPLEAQALLDFVNSPSADGAYVTIGSDLWSLSKEAALDQLLKAVLPFPVPPFDEDSIYEEEGRSRMKIREKLNLRGRSIRVDDLNYFQSDLRKAIEITITENRVPLVVQEELNERIGHCRQIFDYETGEPKLDFNPEAGELAQFDLSVLSAPAIAKFLHLYVERLGRCEFKGTSGVCGQFYIAIRKGRKTTCNKHTKSESQARYREAHRLEIRNKARERRYNDAVPRLVQRKRRS